MKPRRIAFKQKLNITDSVPSDTTPSVNPLKELPFEINTLLDTPFGVGEFRGITEEFDKYDKYAVRIGDEVINVKSTEVQKYISPMEKLKLLGWFIAFQNDSYLILDKNNGWVVETLILEKYPYSDRWMVFAMPKYIYWEVVKIVSDLMKELDKNNEG